MSQLEHRETELLARVATLEARHARIMGHTDINDDKEKDMANGVPSKHVQLRD